MGACRLGERGSKMWADAQPSHCTAIIRSNAGRAGKPRSPIVAKRQTRRASGHDRHYDAQASRGYTAREEAMSNISRRSFLGSAGAFALAAATGAPARAAMGPNDKFDLLIKNADLLDPSQ